jgi:hypothetical protein
MTMLSDLNNLAGGGEKLPTFRFKRVGDAAKGKVLRSSIVELTDRETGKQKKSLVVELELAQCKGGIVSTVVDDDGIEQTKVSDYAPGDRVAVWLNPGFGIGAIRDALHAAAAAALEDGATLKVKLAERRDVGKQSPANVFEAEYEAPTGGVRADDL